MDTIVKFNVNKKNNNNKKKNFNNVQETMNMEDRMFITCPIFGMSWGSFSHFIPFFFLLLWFTNKNLNQFYINILKESMTSKFLTFLNIPEINLVLFFLLLIFILFTVLFLPFREATRAFLYNTKIENCSHILYYMYV